MYIIKQDGGHGGLLGFPIGTILAIFDLQVTLMLPTKFKVNKPFDSREAKNRFSRWLPWQPSWISDQKYFSYFYAPPPKKWRGIMLYPLKFWVCHRPHHSSARNSSYSFRPSWISYLNDFSYFLSTSRPDASYQVSSQLAQGCRRKCWRRTLTDHNSSPWALRAQLGELKTWPPGGRAYFPYVSV